jgi:hypothetical protein
VHCDEALCQRFDTHRTYCGFARTSRFSAVTGSFRDFCSLLHAQFAIGRAWHALFPHIKLGETCHATTLTTVCFRAPNRLRHTQFCCAQRRRPWRLSPSRNVRYAIGQRYPRCGCQTRIERRIERPAAMRLLTAPKGCAADKLRMQNRELAGTGLKL